MNGSSLLPSMPDDFQRALKQSRLYEFFVECAYVHRAGYLSWILTSVRPATRRLRIQQAVARLQAQRSEVLATARRSQPAEIHRPTVVIPPAAPCADERQSA